MQHPWRTIARTVVQLVIGLLPALPWLVEASGIPETAAGVGVLLAVSGAATRLMADPRIDALLATVAPWMAAAPKAREVER
ncbi:hypothetical protein IRT45_36110 [Nocardia sp. BSTN01]|nr:hypothetical protein [Nocardia sp. BSTN01]